MSPGPAAGIENAARLRRSTVRIPEGRDPFDLPVTVATASLVDGVIPGGGRLIWRSWLRNGRWHAQTVPSFRVDETMNSSSIRTIESLAHVHQIEAPGGEACHDDRWESFPDHRTRSMESRHHLMETCGASSGAGKVVSRNHADAPHLFRFQNARDRLLESSGHGPSHSPDQGIDGLFNDRTGDPRHRSRAAE